MLLATSRWEELQTLIEVRLTGNSPLVVYTYTPQDYIVDQWDLACNSEEFERCCQEVAMGEYVGLSVFLKDNSHRA